MPAVWLTGMHLKGFAGLADLRTSQRKVQYADALALLKKEQVESPKNRCHQPMYWAQIEKVDQSGEVPRKAVFMRLKP